MKIGTFWNTERESNIECSFSQYTYNYIDRLFVCIVIGSSSKSNIKNEGV